MIIAFILFALVVSVSVTLLLLRAFVKLSSKYKTTGQENPENMLIKQHKNELREDYSLGLIESKQYSFAQNELEGNFSEKLSAVKAIHDEKSIAPFFALISSLLFCGIAGLIYFYVGNYEAINDNPIGREESFDISEEKFLEMTEQLAEQLKNNPSDVKGWTMLAKSYRLLGRLNDSAEALKKAAKLDPKNADILADYAEALVLANKGDFRGEPNSLLKRALSIDPKNLKALALSGTALFEIGNYSGAIKAWRNLLSIVSGDEKLAAVVRDSILQAENMISKGATGFQVSGVVDIDPNVMKNFDPQDTVFIFLKFDNGPPMPIAAQKIAISDLPYKFAFDANSVLDSSLQFSLEDQVFVGVRVTKNQSVIKDDKGIEIYSNVFSLGKSANLKFMIERSLK